MESPKATLDEFAQRLVHECKFSDGSISFLLDKNFASEDFKKMYEAMSLPNQTFEQRRKSKSWLEVMLDRGDSPEMAPGRYGRYIDGFEDISSEQALVKGRMKFAVEYVIELADLISTSTKSKLVDRAFTEDEKAKLRSIYEKFETKDYAAVKIIEKKTDHDLVAANAWVTIRAQQLGLDDNLMRRITHFARTSADVNTNVEGEIYTKAIGKWSSSVIELLTELQSRAKTYLDLSCVAQTHGQDAQLTTFGFIYANLAEQIRLHAESLPLLLDGKIAGAIGTDVDWKAAFPDVDAKPMYKKIVEEKFGLKFIELGNDQDCTNAALSKALDTMVDVGFVIQKAANDVWHYASRGILAKKTKKGESGSSAMPQKANPFLAEGCEALVSIYTAMINPIKEVIIAYRTQGDLRRSITKREAFHPIMLAIIATKRLTEEIKKYDPNIIAIEQEVYNQGPKIISSSLQNYLREKGIPDAYDAIKGVVMKPFVRVEEVINCVEDMWEADKIDRTTTDEVISRLRSVMDINDYMSRIRSGEEKLSDLISGLNTYNKNDTRAKLLGDAIPNTLKMIDRIEETKLQLQNYAKKAA